MPLIPIGQTFWVITVIVLAVALGLLTMGVIWTFERRRALLPDATRYENLTDRVAALEVRRLELDDLLRALDQKIHDRDRIGAEVAALTERLESLRAELAALDGAERQIEEMKQKAANAVATFAVESGKLEEAKQVLKETLDRSAEALGRLERFKKDADDLEADIRMRCETLPVEIEQLQAELAELQKEKAAVSQEIAQHKGELATLFAAREETAALAARNQTLEERHRELGETLLPKTDKLKEELNDLRAKHETLSQEVQHLQGAREALIAAREEASTLAARLDGLQREVDTARQTRDDMLSGQELEAPKRERARLIDEISGLQAERAGFRQMATDVDTLAARKVTLEEDVARLRTEIAQLCAEIGAGGVDLGDPANVAAELILVPPCLESAPTERFPAQEEGAALHAVMRHLADLGLQYNKRTIYAFHTALKINDTSQMTVLAGVSGTGKSLLPRRYAEAMGIHFLQIAVEPRWDSPQDLLGFYNYIEKRYRATDLARALVQMDPYRTSDLLKNPHEDEIMLVLLDEMNLARVEYYFSEFLSRLEVRPRLGAADIRERRSAACLTLDIPGRPEGPIRLFPSHNVLFAGTMNDDESTQSLSDKVLDRSNVMQFPAPERFARVGENVPALGMNQYRSFKAWQKWILPTDRLVGGERTKVEQVVDKLAGIMNGCGRPFGHRLNEAILAYVVNYPLDPGMAVDVPLVDQVELRILPKLRGLAIDDHKQAFDNLVTLIDQDLRDSALARSLGNLLERQRDGTGQFNWRGFNR